MFDSAPTLIVVVAVFVVVVVVVVVVVEVSTECLVDVCTHINKVT